MDRVHLAVAPEWKFDLLYLFYIDFVANLQKLYLELGVSKWGESNFVGFILKCLEYEIYCLEYFSRRIKLSKISAFKIVSIL